MRKPVVDYRKLRLNNLRSPEFSHLLWLLGWPIYFIFYFLTENLIPEEACYNIHIFLDDLIPFNEIFVIPYVGWYFLIVFSLLYFALYNIENFKGLQKYIITTQAVAMAIYILFPSRQELRPMMDAFPRDNFLTDIVKFLYAFDTPTGVCPSLHVAYSLGIASAWLKEKSAGKTAKTLVVIAVVLICISVVFVKQHSAADIFAAIPVCILAEWIAFGKSFWKEKLNKA